MKRKIFTVGIVVLSLVVFAGCQKKPAAKVIPETKTSTATLDILPSTQETTTATLQIKPGPGATGTQENNGIIQGSVQTTNSTSTVVQ